MDDLQALLSAHQGVIVNYHQTGRLLTILNIGCNCISTRDLRYTFEQIYLGQQNCFRMSASLGYVLQDITNNDLSYYRPSLNNQLIFKTSNSIIKTQLDFQTI